MEKKLNGIVMEFVIVGIFMYLFISAVMDLTNKQDLHTVHINAAFEMLGVEHTVNGFIPVGTDYYYVGIEQETGYAYTIKASKKWFRKNFASDNMALDANGMQLTALSREIRNSELSEELTSLALQIEGVDYPLGITYCLDVEYKSTAIKKIILVFVLAFLAIAGVYIINNKDIVEPIYIKCWLAALVISLVLLVAVL